MSYNNGEKRTANSSLWEQWPQNDKHTTIVCDCIVMDFDYGLCKLKEIRHFMESTGGLKNQAFVCAREQWPKSCTGVIWWGTDFPHCAQELTAACAVSLSVLTEVCARGESGGTPYFLLAGLSRFPAPSLSLCDWFAECWCPDGMSMTDIFSLYSMRLTGWLCSA